MSRLIDMTGKRFGMLVVERQAAGETSTWWVKCDCGNIKTVKRTNLVTGNTRSCGCLKKKTAKEVCGKHFKKYKEARRAFWRSMMGRGNRKQREEK